MNKMENSSLIMCVNKAIARCVSYEEIGDVTEFYDEDGCVVMTAASDDMHKIEFTFPQDDVSFELEEKEPFDEE